MEKLILDQAALISDELAQLLKTTVLVMPNWKWGVLLTAIVLGFILRPVIQFILKEIKKHNPFTKKYPKSFSAFFLNLPVEKPIAWLLVIFFFFAIGDAVALSGKFETYYNHFLRGLVALCLIRVIYYAVDALSSVFMEMAAKTESTYDDQLVPFASKALKVLVVVLGVLIALQSFGLNVMSLLAGLGLGGLALALAAQDTAANLFGSITILVDHPFKIGDWVKVKDMEGTVEEIGFRSTRIRTFYNSLITIPNAMMAKETIDNMGVRPARRSRQILGLAYETPPEKINSFCEHVRYMIKQHPKVNPETVTVHFNNYNASSLDVLVNFHLNVFTGPEELENQQQIFIEILKIAADMKVDFAYPTQTVYYKSAEPATPSLTTT
ncbi:mechanosensitive ion channel family protein [Bdellovibrio sp. 22V]|uniref:mechanosensitive ion channel family protein n=1 Tax=Bdellovibrio TaxID=958 RepID=UPI0025432E37|nr:mechanosensitive ion channel family protein [Bdellovibrio sp. 22V]WII72334.1 mechanosensitive ion channel family protein [Bdellovibrio sp. 22V]